MEQSDARTEQFFNNREETSERLDGLLAWYDELGTNLMEPSTTRTAENIAELREWRKVAVRDMGILAARLAEFDDVDVAAELDVMMTNSEILAEVN